MGFNHTGHKRFALCVDNNVAFLCRNGCVTDLNNTFVFNGNRAGNQVTTAAVEDIGVINYCTHKRHLFFWIYAYVGTLRYLFKYLFFC